MIINEYINIELIDAEILNLLDDAKYEEVENIINERTELFDLKKMPTIEEQCNMLELLKLLSINYTVYPLALGIANIYFYGSEEMKNIEEDIDTAVYFYKLAAERNSAEANHMLLGLYLSGIGVEKTFEIALQYAEKAMLLGHLNATEVLAEHYLNNDYTPSDLNEFVYFIELAASENNEYSIICLATFYTDVYLEKDIEKAIELFNTCIELNNSTAMWKLGLLYVDEGINFEKGLSYFEKSSILKNDMATNWLSGWFICNSYTPHNYEVFLDSLNSSIKNNMTFAIIAKSYMYEKGIYLEKDLSKAIELLKTGINSQRGDFAIFYLGKLLIENDLDFKEGILYLKKAADMNNESAMNYLVNL